MTESEIKTAAEQYYPDVYRFAFAKTRNKEAALDLTQETFLTFLQKAQGLEDDKISAWLICVCANKCKEYFRAKKKELNYVSIEEIGDLSDEDTPEETATDPEELFNAVQKKILTLLTPAEQKEFIELFIQKKEIRIFAEENNISENAANVRKSRLKKKVKQLYKNTCFLFLVLYFKIFSCGM